MNRISIGLSLAALCGMTLWNAMGDTAEPTPEQIDFFERKVRPLFVDRCYNCHSAETKPAGGLRLDDRGGFFMGGDSGPDAEG
jgi:hypothetical protein